MTEYITEWYWDEMRNAPNQDQREEIIRCRVCKYYEFVQEDSGDWCEYWTDRVYRADGFCAWGERRERESAEVWNQWSADDVTCSEES